MPVKQGKGANGSVEGLVEYARWRTQNARFFGAPGGGPHVAQLFAAPVNYQDEDGKWRPIDTHIVATDGGYKNAANSHHLFFPEVLDPLSPMKIDYPQGSLEVTLVGALGSRAEVTDYSVTYRDARPSTDLAFETTTTGYKETVTLTSREGPGRVTYSLVSQGLTLALEEDGSVAVRAGDKTIAHFTRPYAEDSNFSEDNFGDGVITHDLDVSLREHAPGTYEYTVEVPPSWLHDPDRVFPVVIDPSLAETLEWGGGLDTVPDVQLLKDTYIRSADPVPPPSHASESELRVGSLPDGTTHTRSFMTFDIRQLLRTLGNFVYDSEFEIFNFDSQAVTPLAKLVELKRITEPWVATGDERITWSFQPAVNEEVYAQDVGCGETRTGCEPRHVYDIARLMQWWIDHPDDAAGDLGSNHGFRLSSPLNEFPNWKRYRSSEYTVADDRPYIFAVINALPSSCSTELPSAPAPPAFPDPCVEISPTAIPDGEDVESPPFLAIKDLIDINGDNVVVRYQVAKKSFSDPSFSSSDIVYDTEWIDEIHQVPVPSSALAEDRTYYWRVKAWDVCDEPYVDPDAPDPIEDPDAPRFCDDLVQGSVANPSPQKAPVSQERSFNFKFKHHGTDNRWAMWRQSLGNDMGLSVNQATGNLNLHYTLDSLATVAGPFELSLAYNSFAAAETPPDSSPGLAAGWDLTAGPSPNPAQFPVRVEAMGSDFDPFGVVVVNASGRRDYYAEIEPDHFGTVGPAAGSIRRSFDATGLTTGYLLTTYTGGTYEFDKDGHLSKARPQTFPLSLDSGGSFRYDYLPPVEEGRIDSITDTAQSRTIDLDYYTSSNLLKTITTWDARSWSFAYDANQRLVRITEPGNTVINLGYDASGRLLGIRDGASPNSGDPETTIAYELIGGRDRTFEVTLAGTDDPWRFGYYDLDKRFSDHTDVYDPRAADDPSNADLFKTTTDFNSVGLPSQIARPPINGNRPVTRMMWDSNGNLLCRKDPLATATEQGLEDNETCVSLLTIANPLHTEFSYQHRAPYLLTEVTGPAPSESEQQKRLVTTYRYDEDGSGAPFPGLQVQYFSNPRLEGLPDAVAIASGAFDHSWATTPPQLDGSVKDEFSIRYFGEIRADHSSPEGPATYSFRLTRGPGDGARLAIGKELVLDCWDPSQGCPEKSLQLSKGPHAIVVEYNFKDHDFPSQIKLEWLKPNGNWETVPGTALLPDTDVPSAIKTGTEADANAFSETTNLYGSDEHKIRGLATKVKLEGPGLDSAETTDFTYDDFGRITTEIDATGAAILYSYGSSADLPT